MITLYHHATCSKSKAALEKVIRAQIPFKVVDYIANPLSEKELEALYRKMSDVPVTELCREELPENITREEVFSLLAQRPEVLQRPILVCGEDAIIGRPTERIDEFLIKIASK